MSVLCNRIHLLELIAGQGISIANPPADECVYSIHKFTPEVCI